MQENAPITPFNRREHCKKIGFQKGQSGNPAGKKLGTKNILHRLMDRAAATVAFDAYGNPLSAEQMIAKTLVDEGIKGNLKAIKLIVKLKYGKTAHSPVKITTHETLSEIISAHRS